MFCPPVSRLGNGESPESCSSRSKLNYIHQPGASTIVPRAFPALIRIFLFSLGEGGQPISTSITLPEARTWNCRARGPTDGAASRRRADGWDATLNGGPSAFFLPPSASWCDAKTGGENPAGSVFEEDTCMHVYIHTHRAMGDKGVNSLARGSKFKCKHHGTPHTPKQSGEGSSASEKFNAGFLCNF